MPTKLKKIPSQLILDLREFLGYDGCAFFTCLKEDTGTVSPVLQDPDSGFPHLVHFREGMVIRNWLRQSGHCPGWSDHDFDNNWQRIVELAIYA